MVASTDVQILLRLRPYPMEGHCLLQSCTISVSSALDAWHLTTQLWLEKLVAIVLLVQQNLTYKGTEQKPYPHAY